MRLSGAMAVVLAVCCACTPTDNTSPPTTAAPAITEIPPGPFDLNALTEMPSVWKMPDQKMTKEQIREACVQTFSNKRFFGRLASQAPGKHEYSLSTALVLVRAEFDTNGLVFEDPRTRRPVCSVNYHWKDTSGTSGERQITLALFDGVMLYQHESAPGTGFIMMPEGSELRVVIFRRPQQRGSYNAFAPIIRNWGVYRPGDL